MGKLARQCLQNWENFMAHNLSNLSTILSKRVSSHNERMSPSTICSTMPCTTPIRNITAATTSSSFFDLCSSLSLPHHGHHDHDTSAVTDTMALPSFLPSSTTSTQSGNKNDRSRLSQILSTCNNGKTGVDRVKALLDAALEIVGEPSEDVDFSCRDGSSIVENDLASSLVRRSFDSSDEYDRRRVTRKQ
jgi:hypothetical protein